jgi:hypothetical protein
MGENFLPHAFFSGAFKPHWAAKWLLLTLELWYFVSLFYPGK